MTLSYLKYHYLVSTTWQNIGTYNCGVNVTEAGPYQLQIYSSVQKKVNQLCGRKTRSDSEVRDFFDTTVKQLFDTFLLHSVGWRGSHLKSPTMLDRTLDNRVWLGYMSLGSKSQNDRFGLLPLEIQTLGVGPEATLGLHLLKCRMRLYGVESELHQRGSGASSNGYTMGPMNPPVE
jgi:hypothetical protein